ncbi:GNAT family N-acetyltransferase [candidate division WOR-3 bacterium]|nr:GNAT family N-acetyltransferase [candidate division WOR-3 bacterium]
MEEKKAIFPELVTKRLVLREFIQKDANAVFEMFSRDAVTKYHNVETMTDLEQARKFVSSRINVFITKAGVRWALALKENPTKAIGSVGYFNLNKPNGFAEVGYDLHQDFWRRGYMEEALSKSIYFGFSEEFFFYLNRVEAMTYPENEASTGLLLKLGFKYEGVRREYGLIKGKYTDLKCFSLLRREW